MSTIAASSFYGSVRHGSRLGAGFFDEMTVDNFAGAGGASMGIEAAIGRSVDVAINHDKHSIEMHSLNHPHTRHLQDDVWNVDPIEATAGRSVGLAWFSPDCRHFSRAKGGKPVEKKIRGLAWIVVKWAKKVRPRVIILENVREFQDWGPLTEDMRPCKDRKGQTFRRWKKQLENLGYSVDHRVLNAADYGAPTHRRRFFLVARRDGMPIVWPEPSHGPGRKYYRTAAECIDWTLPCPSIFLTKAESKVLGVIRPLADKTMRRIAMGLKRYVLDNPKPFIVTCNHGGPEFRGQSIDEPMCTITGARDAHGLVTPFVTQLAHGGNGGTWDDGRSKDPRDPLGTVHSGGNNHAVTAPYIVRTDNHQSHATNAFDPHAPLGTVDQPIHTVTPANNSGVLIAPTLIGAGGPEYSGKPKPADEPIGTLMTDNRRALCAAFLAKHYGGDRGNCAGRAIGVDGPIGTITTSDHHSLITAHLEQQYGQSRGAAVDSPLGTATACNHHGVVASHLTKLYGTNKDGQSVAAPIPTITADGNHLGEVRAFLIKYFGCGCGQECSEPLHTVTGRDRFGLVSVNGHDYQIADIGLRMLSPRELLRAQFGIYAKDYILTGTKSQQVARIGNSVPPQLAEAMVRANYTQEAEAAA